MKCETFKKKIKISRLVFIFLASFRWDTPWDIPPPPCSSLPEAPKIEYSFFSCPEGYCCGKVWEVLLYKDSLEPHSHWSLGKKIQPVPSVLGCLPLLSTHDHSLCADGQGLWSWGLPWQNVPCSFSPGAHVVWFFKAKLETTLEFGGWNEAFSSLCPIWFGGSGESELWQAQFGSPIKQQTESTPLCIGRMECLQIFE